MDEKFYARNKPKATEKQVNFANAIAKALHKPIPTDISYDAVNNYIKQNLKEYNTIKENKDKSVQDEIKRNIHIIDFAREIGLTPIKKGKYYSLKEHDSVMIDDSKNCFWQNSVAGNGSSIGKGGSVIDFALTFSSSDLHSILKDFSGRLYSYLITKDAVSTRLESDKRKDTEKENQTLVLPERAPSMRNVFAYLIKTRYIDTDIVQSFTDKKMIYQDNHRNCVFVSYENEKPVFASLRGTNTLAEQRFVGDVKNSDYSKGFYIANNAKKLIVTESVIDALSVMTILKANGENFMDYDYAPLCGAAKFDSVVKRLEESTDIDDIYMALDNDTGGIDNMHALEQILKEKGIDVNINENIPDAKDWNQELKDTINQCKGISEIDFFKKNKISPLESIKMEFSKKNQSMNSDVENELEMEM